MSDHDFAFESQPGLPAPLPQGETLLWQGKPDTGALARESFKINWVFGYLMLIAIWRGGATLADAGIPQALAVFLPYAALAAAGYGVIYALAWASARATIYSITSARVIMRIGAALQVTYTVPFTRVATASADIRPSGTGTIALDLTEGARLATRQSASCNTITGGWWPKTRTARRQSNSTPLARTTRPRLNG